MVDAPSRAMRRALLAWLSLSLVGALLIARPDTGPRLISFSAAHGPSALDAAGIMIALAGYAWFLLAAWGARHPIAAMLHGLRGAAVAFALGLGAGLVVASVASDFAGWWAMGAAILGAAQVGPALLTMR